MAAKKPPPFNTFPTSVKKGILFLLLSWISHFFFLYKLWLVGIKIDKSIVDQKLILQMAVIAVLVCFFVIRIRNWARVLGIVSNIMAISVYVLLFVLFFNYDIILSAIIGINIGLFSTCTFFLFKKDASDFFKLHSPRLGGDGNKEK